MKLFTLNNGNDANLSDSAAKLTRDDEEIDITTQENIIPSYQLYSFIND